MTTLDEYQRPGEELEPEEEFEAEFERIEETAFEAETPQQTGTCFLLSVVYSGRKGRALCKLLDPSTNKIVFWYDNTGHEPYCLADVSPQELEESRVPKHHGFDGYEPIQKYDTLKGEYHPMLKVFAKDPLSIGGKNGESIRELLPKAWEANIKYYDNYIFDRHLIPGMPYRIIKGNLKPEGHEADPALLSEVVKALGSNVPEIQGELQAWLPLFSIPAPEIRRVALDIEVETPIVDRIPSPQKAENRVIAVSFCASDGVRKVLLLRRGQGKTEQLHDLGEGVKLQSYDSEQQLLREVFRYLLEYPVVITFNGDAFDLRYLANRAMRLGMPRSEVPINLSKEYALLPTGIHVDLYKFFDNRSIQIYAFEGRYKEYTLDAIAAALLGINKIQIERNINDLTSTELAAYCFRDSYLTLSLTTFEDNLVMKFIILLMRISKMPMEDATRLKVSGWVRNLFFYEHRKRDYLIPLPEDILGIKGQATTKAIIKGKKYQGAIVYEPQTGVYFNVAVLDFASLYPSIISRWNLSYESIRCNHNECRGNKIPGTEHWVCNKNRGLSALVIGLLRDLRVNWLKPITKQKNLELTVRSWYQVVTRGLKVILNASYGVFGATQYHFYCPPVAESTAALGRHVIEKTVDFAKSTSTKVIYGDTDSVFIHQPTEEQIASLVDWSRRELGIELDLDKSYRYVTFSGRKKNYLGVYQDGSVDIKGLVGKKSNTPDFLKDAFYDMVHILSEIQSAEDFTEAQAKIRDILKDCRSRLKNRSYTLDQLAIRIMMSKDPAEYRKSTPIHVNAARQLGQKGKYVQAGDIISFIRTKGEVTVRPVQLARIDEVDAEKYVSSIRTTFEQVLDAMDLDFDEVLGEARLDRFFAG